MPIKLIQFDQGVIQSGDFFYVARTDRTPREEIKVTVDDVINYVEQNLDGAITRTTLDVYSTSEVDTAISDAGVTQQAYTDTVAKSEAIKFALVLG